MLPVQLRFGDAATSGVIASLAGDGNPFDVGVWWVYCTVPNEAPNGDAINVAIGAGAAASNVATVPIAGAAPAVAAPKLLSIGGYPAVNATGGYNPTSAISISASGAYTNVSTYVKFADSTGCSAIPVAQQFSSNSIE
jgi:hypothetical protein